MPTAGTNKVAIKSYVEDPIRNIPFKSFDKRMTKALLLKKTPFKPHHFTQSDIFIKILKLGEYM
jgi:hypothetical protein